MNQNPTLESVGTTALTPAAEAVTEYLHAARAERTRQAYRQGLERFLKHGGRLPASPEQVAQYLAAHGRTHKPATLTLWVVSIGLAHTSQGWANPCHSALVRTTLRGIRRRQGAAPRQVAPVLRDDLVRLVSALGERPRERRDRALLLVGFAGAFRRSELVALTVADLSFSEPGVKIRLRRSKTDPERQGQWIAIPYARGPVCPVRALEDWLLHSIDGHPGEHPEVPVFRPVNRHDQVAAQALSDHAVAQIIKERCRAAGLDPAQYSGHSLRAGFCTSAALNGAPNWKIKKQSRHKTDAMLSRYIRDARLFADNPLEGLF